MSYLINRKNDLDLFKDTWLTNFLGEPIMSKGFNNLMKTDIIENDTSYELSVEMPGFDKENIKISLEDGNLTIEGNITKNEDDSDNKEKRHFIRKERFFGTVSRTYYVGEAVTNEDISASFKNGVLVVSVPKKELEKKENKSFITIE